MSKRKIQADRVEETPHTEEDLDSKTVKESSTVASMLSDTDNLEKLLKAMVASMGENIHTEDELQNKSVGESHTKSSDTQILREPSNIMVASTGQNVHTEEELQNKSVGESHIKSSESEIWGEPPKLTVEENVHTEEGLQKKSVGKSHIKSSETEIWGEPPKLMAVSTREKVHTEEEVQNKSVDELHIKPPKIESFGELSKPMAAGIEDDRQIDEELIFEKHDSLVCELFDTDCKDVFKLMIASLAENQNIEEEKEVHGKCVSESHIKSSESEKLKEPSKLVIASLAENQNIEEEEELLHKCVGESHIKSSESEKLKEPSKLMSAGTGEVIQREAKNENLEQPLQPMAVCSEETSEGQKEDTKQYLYHIIDDLQETLKPHRLTVTEFEHSKQTILKNSTFNSEKPQVDLSGDNGGAEEQLQFLQCKQTVFMNSVVEDVQKTFQRHGMILKNIIINCLNQAGESPSLSETEKSDEESMDFPEPPAKRRKCEWYTIEAKVQDLKDQLPGPSGINPSSSKASDVQEQVISSSESEADA